MLSHALAVARAFLAIFACRADLILENLALRQQVAVLQRKQPRPRLRAFDEVLKLGLEVSERTVSRTMPRRPTHPDERQRRRTFLANHREGLATIDFFTVPTATCRVLYVFFVVHDTRRELMHFRVTGHPTAAWITQQLREAFPYGQAPRYLILDRDAKYGHEVLTAIHHLVITPKADHDSQSLAERSRRENRQHRTRRASRSRHRPHREALAAPPGRLRLLLPQRPVALVPGEGDARGARRGAEAASSRRGHRSASPRRASPSLRLVLRGLRVLLDKSTAAVSLWRACALAGTRTAATAVSRWA